MTEPKEFFIGDVLSITTGRLLSPAKYHADNRTHRMDGIYQIVSHLMGCEVWTHQLPAYAKPCAEAIYNQHPIFNSVEMQADFEKYQAGFDACPEEDKDKYLDGWVSTMAAKYGETWSLKPIEAAEAYQRDPLEHLIEMRGGSEEGIIAITPGE